MSLGDMICGTTVQYSIDQNIVIQCLAVLIIKNVLDTLHDGKM
jgi:hypothetical protein